MSVPVYATLPLKSESSSSGRRSRTRTPRATTHPDRESARRATPTRCPARDSSELAVDVKSRQLRHARSPGRDGSREGPPKPRVTRASQNLQRPTSTRAEVEVASLARPERSDGHGARAFPSRPSTLEASRAPSFTPCALESRSESSTPKSFAGCSDERLSPVTRDEACQKPRGIDVLSAYAPGTCAGAPLPLRTPDGTRPRAAPSPTRSRAARRARRRSPSRSPTR